MCARLCCVYVDGGVYRGRIREKEGGGEEDRWENKRTTEEKGEKKKRKTWKRGEKEEKDAVDDALFLLAGDDGGAWFRWVCFCVHVFFTSSFKHMKKKKKNEE